MQLLTSWLGVARSGILALAPFLVAGTGFALLAAWAYWALVLSEGVYLGPRVVTWLYDRVARRYDRIKNLDPLDDERCLARPLLQALRGVAEPRVLDLATGTGRLPVALLSLSEFPGRVVGLDRSVPMLAEAQRKLAGRAVVAPLLLADAGHLPFGDLAFDAVSCLEALEFTADPRATLSEIRRVLRPGGLLLISNRVGWDALWFPGRCCGRGRLEAQLGAMGIQVVESERWQVYYDLVWACKTGAP